MHLFFGGSFDPVHVGHLIVGRDVQEQLRAQKVIFLPANQAPLKGSHKASPHDRLNMIEIAIKEFDSFDVFDLEIKRGGISYTVDTAQELLKKYGDKPHFILGADSILTLHMWKDPKRLTSVAKFVVVDRAGKAKEVVSYFKEMFPNLKEDEDYIILNVRRIDVSSTEIRSRIKEGRSIKWLVPEGVESYILERGLYR